MRRRDFIAGLGGAAAAWPLAAGAQQGDRVRRVGMLIPWREGDPDTEASMAMFVEALALTGWREGRNLHIERRSTGGDLELARRYAKELVAQQPDVIFAESTLQTAAVQRETRTIPIVFVAVTDPVGSGFVAGLAHPGGNITGFTHQEASMAAKWVELVGKLAPGRKLMAAMYDPDTAPYVESYYLPQFEAAVRSLKAQSIVLKIRSEAVLETALTSLGQGPAAGLIVMPDSFMFVHRAQIIARAMQYRLPTLYFHVRWAREGGLISYGPETGTQYQLAAGYIDRILKGASPADLPIQAPIKYEMTINLKTARALGLVVPRGLLAIADAVIE